MRKFFFGPLRNGHDDYFILRVWQEFFQEKLEFSHFHTKHMKKRAKKFCLGNGSISVHRMRAKNKKKYWPAEMVSTCRLHFFTVLRAVQFFFFPQIHLSPSLQGAPGDGGGGKGADMRRRAAQGVKH